jgi:hypothetical protein
MSRSGYIDDCDDQWSWIRYRGAVKSAMHGRRGQAFFKELVAALDALPEKRLIAGSLKIEDGAVCSLGAVALKRGIDTEPLEGAFEDENHAMVAKALDIAECLTREVVYENDECGRFVPDGDKYRKETPEERWQRMRAWAESHILEPVSS